MSTDPDGRGICYSGPHSRTLCVTSALLIACFLLLTPELSSCQTPALTYVTKDWLHLHSAPNDIPELKQGKSVIVLANDLDLSDNSYRGGSSGSSLTIIADTLHLTKPANIILSAPPNQAGPNICLIVRHLEVEEDGFLQLISSGNPGGALSVIYGDVIYGPSTKPVQQTNRFDFYKHINGTGDKALLAAELASSQDAMILDDSSGETSVPAGPGVERVTRYSGKSGHALRGSLYLNSEGISMAEGPPGTRIAAGIPLFGGGFTIGGPIAPTPFPGMPLITADFKHSAEQLAPGDSLSLWSVSLLEETAIEIEAAKLAGDREHQIALFQRVHTLAANGFSISNALGDRYDSVVTRLTSLQSELLPPVYQDTVTIMTASGEPKSLTRFVEKGSLQNRLAPTAALIEPHLVGEKKLLGLVGTAPGSDTKIQLAFDALLSLDSMSSSLASQQLSKTNESVSGIFSNWTLYSPKIEADGISSYSVNSALGNTIQVSLTLDEAQGNLALWRLWSDAGIPLDLQYKCNADPAVTGHIVVPLSFLRRSSPDLRVDAGKVINTGSEPFAIEYFMQDSQIVPLNPFKVVQPDVHQPVELGILPGTDISKVSIGVPPEAIQYVEDDPFSLQDFESSLGADLIESVIVQDLLDAYDQTLRLPLDYVEVTITYQAANGTTAVAGPYRLAARGAVGSQITAHFLKPRSGNYSFVLKGTAYYDHQRTKRTFSSPPSSDVTMNIDTNLFSVP